MLQYIETGVASDEATKVIDEEVIETRIKEEWREEYMLTLTYRDELYVEAHEEGLADGRAEVIAKMLSNGRNPEQIAEFCGYELQEVLDVQAKIN